MANGRKQFIEIDGLAQVVEGAVPHGTDGFTDVSIGGDEQDRQRGVLLAGATHGFQAGNAGHADVRDHHRYLLLFENFQRLLTGTDSDGFKSLAGEKGGEQASLAWIIVDDQHAREFTRRFYT